MKYAAHFPTPGSQCYADVPCCATKGGLDQISDFFMPAQVSHSRPSLSRSALVASFPFRVELALPW